MPGVPLCDIQWLPVSGAHSVLHLPRDCRRESFRRFHEHGDDAFQCPSEVWIPPSRQRCTPEDQANHQPVRVMWRSWWWLVSVLLCHRNSPHCMKKNGQCSSTILFDNTTCLTVRARIGSGWTVKEPHAPAPRTLHRRVLHTLCLLLLSFDDVAVHLHVFCTSVQI